jgi:hypothetical protein
MSCPRWLGEYQNKDFLPYFITLILNQNLSIHNRYSFVFRNLQMMMKHHHLLYNFMSRMSRSHNIEQASLQKFILSSLHQPRIKKLYVNSPIPKLSSQEVASLVRSKRELTYAHITGGTEERNGGLQARTGGTKERTGGTEEITGGTEERTVGNKERTGGTIERTGSTIERTGGTQERTGGTIERTGGTEARTGGIKKRTDGTKERTGGTKDNNKQWNSPIPKPSSKKVVSLVRVQRDLSRLSRRSGGTEEETGGTEERTGGSEERTGGTEERTGGSEDSYKQWRKMG